MDMTDKTQNDSLLDAGGESRVPVARVDLIRVGSPEHAAMIARALRLAPQGPPPTPAQRTAPTAPQPSPRRRFTRKRKPRPPREPDPTCDRHGRKCTICSDPYCDEIEELFLDWRDPSSIASEMGVPVRTIYRHAHATGLYAKRQGKLRSVLDRLLEGAESAQINGDCIIRAVRAYACLGRNNKWTEPSSNVVFSSRKFRESANATSSIGVKPKIKRLPRAARRRGKIRDRKPRVLIDTKAIRNQRKPLKTRSRR